MNNYNEIHFQLLPDFEFHRPAAVKHLPHSVECGSRWRTNGSSAGWNSEVVKAANGKHLERKHFYLDIEVSDKNPISQGLYPNETAALTSALAQTAKENSKTEISSHRFDRTEVYRIVDLSRCSIPTALIALNSCSDTDDNRFYPNRDTCGCSAHSNLELAILGAIKEALERQFLLRCWLTKTCSGVISLSEATSALSGRASKKILKALSNAGDIAFLDLTDKGFPGRCVLACYGDDSAKPKPVRFCAGMSYASDLESALEKSLIELWQTFRYMHSFSSTAKDINAIEDSYLRHFLSCNRYSTYSAMTSVTSTSPKCDNEHAQQNFDTATLMRTLKTLKFDGYLYVSTTACVESIVYFCKYTSPNLFLHMNNSSHFNLHNRYSQDFQDQFIVEQLNTMVPFP
ncbi:YcaO-like family protein [Pseudomonas parafulva]|uniref:Microcin B17-processing protein McbD n=1 Tax=Pseudomonas parafulva TaxID=157782 RepID=A0ABN4XXH1_9PSED|nr:YcaO-like family protein [Pseudomonas parafulva]AQW69205.1 microcin B17-processing protein McbD [Pseudomonas parafulva]